MAPALRPRRTLLVPGVLALLGVLLSLWHGGRPSVWFDELATGSAVDRSPGELWHLLTNIDAVHGLYYWGVRTFSLAFGVDETALRAFSALGVGAATAACYVLARRLGGETFALVAGVITLVLPRLTWSGVEARSYSWVIASAALVLIAAHRAASSAVAAGTASGRRGDPLTRAWLAYGAALLLATVLFLYSATLVLAVAVVFLADERTRTRAVLRPAAIASAAAVVLASPVVILAATQRDQVAWLRWPGWRIFQNVLVDQWFDHSTAFAVAAWLVIAVAALLWWRRGIGSARARDGGPADAAPSGMSPTDLASVLRYGLAGALVPLAAILLVSPVVPSYVGRYVSFTVPGVVLVLAAAVTTVARLLPRPRVAGAALLVVLAVTAIPGYLWQHSPLSKPGGSDFSYAARYIRDNARPGDCVFFQVQPSWAWPSLRIAHDGLPGMFDGLHDMGNDGDRREEGKLWDKEKGVNQWASWAADECTAAWVLTDADRAEDDFRQENGNLWWTFRPFQFMGTDMQVSLDYGGLAVVHQEQFHILQVVHLVQPPPAEGPDPQPLPRTRHTYW
ncbi:glycosyltransferase family 39 protein [Tsukamurella paurometabola]|uniref:Predicted membrane protein n=1 Tax=Tsukamurella paurometabola TaxID=2061 RepID=A0A3P8L1T1_TSUPA|nr:glycosyltransferase family 39 protein [Tsukamurella paurometabola]UEA81599.1 glycosyltransferase family 39 protein [Tsukamurella paurometabola]VDR38605.1 Predicted membrane protein [Tsukamurella paurometabola]